VLSIKPKEREFLHEDGCLILERVLCPCDLSEASLLSAELAADFCRLFEAEMILLHTIDSRVEYPLLMPNADLPTSAQLHEHAVEQLTALANRYADVEIRIEVVTGVPHKTINEAANNDKADVIVMATHGRTGLGRALLGSTVEKVVRTSPVPTLTTRPAEAEKDEEPARAVGLKPTLAI
jgi:nucleotide-binding universal stress UspA family protein